MSADDDLATCPTPYKVVAVIPVHGRVPLLPYTIKRLIQKNDCKVICVGDGLHEKQVCEQSGAVWVPFKNSPLGAKWNAGFVAAKRFNPDAVLYVGSSDWVCNDWIKLLKPYVDLHGMAGVPGCHFMDIQSKIRLVNWNGYIGERSNETIGIGRLLGRDVLEKIHWKPFHDDKNSSLDRSMKDKCAQVGVHDFMVRDERLKAVSISTSMWENKHKFDQHWNNLLPSDKISDTTEFLNYFPEALQLQKELYANQSGIRV